MTSSCYFSNVIGTCGVGVEFSFTNRNYGSQQVGSGFRQVGTRFGGIDYNIAGFVNTKRCKQAYETIKNKADIVFQSPVKRNSNSGNQFFFIVYKRKGA